MMAIVARSDRAASHSPPGPATHASPRARGDRAWVEIDLGGLIDNGRAIAAAAPGAALLAVVKADAYGLGAVAVARALGPLDPWGFAVATIDEGLRLREAGVERPILVLMPARPDLLDGYKRGRLRAVLEDPAVAACWGLPFHVEIDTGMGRCGIRWDDRRVIRAIGAARPEGVFTHLHSADEQPDTVATQWRRFRGALAALSPRPPLVHAANTAGIWRLREPLDLVRPGIFLYGGRAAADLPAPRPVLSVRARVVSTRRIRRGDTISYGADWRAENDTVIATLGIGYADGIPRCVQGRARVLIDGRHRPAVGRITMDLTMVDLGPDGAARPGDIATVLGPDGDEAITLDDVAAWSGTCCYEVLTRLSPRLPRHYLAG